MAIFGKKKEKNDKADTSAASTAAGASSPTMEGRSSLAGRNGSRETTPASVSGHKTSGSLSGNPTAPVGILQNGYGSYESTIQGNGSNQGSIRQPGAAGGLPGAANNFRFGGPRPDAGPTGIPMPGSMRGRTVSQDTGVGPQGNGSMLNGSLSNSASVAAFTGPGSSMQQQQQPPQQQQQLQQLQQQQQQPGFGPGPGGGPGPSTQNGQAPPGQMQQLANATPPNGSSTGPSERSRSRGHVNYPWTQRLITMNPPRFIDETRQAPPGALSPSPFPRYGHAANQASSANGEVYLFGGLVRDNVKNDLYVVNVDQVVQPPGEVPAGSPPGTVPPGGGVSTTLAQTSGNIPPPRVGHATVLVSNVLILWGGDTKVRAEDKHDEGLYLLNLSSREWTRVDSDVDNPGPVGRYGHTVSIVGSRFYIFGGQVDGEFMQDFWAFDLNSLKGTPKWQRIEPPGESPARRTGHASVTYKDKIYIFGGTDGQYHYNDTWCYDATANTWKELSCIGYIPVTREGHAACLVDDVMYIFGGRGVDGKELGDLASLKLSSQRWYMFANMGPAPSPRSGHILTTYMNKVIVLGGGAFAGPSRPDDPTVVYVLDTTKIKYPPDSKVNSRKTSLQTNGPPTSPDGARTTSPDQITSADSANRAASPLQLQQRNVSAANAPNGLVGMMQQAAGNGQRSVSAPQQQQPSGVTGSPQRAISPTNPGLRDQRAAYQRGPGGQPGPNGPQRAISPSGQQPAPYGGPRSQRSIENMRGGAISPTSGAPGMVPQRSINGTLDNAAVIQDGFHYGRNASVPNAVGSPTTQSGRGELEAMRKREAWMKAALELAYKKGFVAPDEIELPGGAGIVTGKDPQWGLDNIDIGSEGSDKDRIMKVLLSFKTQLANMKADNARQAQQEAERDAEADRGRVAALQEAIFYRAKLHALESGDTSEASRLDRERAAQNEKQLSDALRESGELERQIMSLREEIKLERNLRQSAEDRLSDTARRAMAAEGAQMRAYDELSNLQKRSHGQDSQLREHQEQVAHLTSLLTQHQTDHQVARGQLTEAQAALDKHQSAVPELQAALAAATARAGEHERLHYQHRDIANSHAENITRLRAALDAKTVEADQHAARIADLEALASTHKAEADAYRSALGGKLAQLLSYQQQQQNTRGVNGNAASGSTPVPEHITEKMRALEQEAESLRQLHGQTRGAADSATTALQDLRTRNVTLEKQHAGLSTELSAMRGQLAIALQEVTRLKDHSSSKDLELKSRSRALEQNQLKDNLLRRYISDRGIDVPGNEELSAKGGFADKRIQELEAEVDQRSREAQESQRRLREATAQMEQLQQSGGAGASRSVNDTGDISEAEQRAELAERELAETTASYRERMGQLENDYQTAVQFVKGTEKMLRRMKDELAKSKSENDHLQYELRSRPDASGQGGSSSQDRSTGAESSAAARDIEALRTRFMDLTRQHEETTNENRQLEQKLAALITDQKEYHDRSKQREDSQLDHARRAGELEVEVTRLRRQIQETSALNQHLSSELNNDSTITSGGSGDSTVTRGAGGQDGQLASQNEHLQAENEALARRLQETEDKLGLLLGRMESTVGGDDIGGGGHQSEEEVYSQSSRGGGGVGGNEGYGLGLRGTGSSRDGHGIGSSMMNDCPSTSTGGGHATTGGEDGGSTSGGKRFSITSELDRWEKDGGLGSMGEFSR